MNEEEFSSGSWVSDILDWRLILFVLVGIAASWGFSWVIKYGMSAVK